MRVGAAGVGHTYVWVMGVLGGTIHDEWVGSLVAATARGREDPRGRRAWHGSESVGAGGESARQGPGPSVGMQGYSQLAGMMSVDSTVDSNVRGGRGRDRAAIARACVWRGKRGHPLRRCGRRRRIPIPILSHLPHFPHHSAPACWFRGLRLERAAPRRAPLGPRVGWGDG